MSIISNLILYFFSPLPEGPFRFMYFFIVLGAISLIGGIVLKVYLKKQKNDKIFKKLFRDLPGKLILIGILEGLYVLVRWQRLPYLSLRFLNYLVLAYVIYVVFHYVQLYIKVYPEDKKHREAQIKKNQYLPRKGGKNR